MNMCLQVSHGPLSEEGQIQLEEQSELLGTGALLMLLPPLPCTGLDDEDIPMLSALLQLKQVQQASGWQTALPLVLLIPDQLEEAVGDQKLEEGIQRHKFKFNDSFYKLVTLFYYFKRLLVNLKPIFYFAVLKLKTLVQDGLISEYNFIHLSGNVTDLQGSKQVSVYYNTHTHQF